MNELMIYPVWGTPFVTLGNRELIRDKEAMNFYKDTLTNEILLLILTVCFSDLSKDAVNRVDKAGIPPLLET